MDTNIGALTGHAGAQSSTASLLPPRPSPPVATPSAVKATDPAVANAAVLTHEPSQEELRKAVDQANTSLLNRSSNELRFAVEEGVGVTVVKLIDLKTGDAIMQFPSKIMLEIAKTIDQVTGAIIKHKA